MWELPGPGLEPVSPALADGFLTTVPPGKPPINSFLLGSISIMLIIHVACLPCVRSQYSVPRDSCPCVDAWHKGGEGGLERSVHPEQGGWGWWVGASGGSRGS